jgi:hypothetical protein
VGPQRPPEPALRLGVELAPSLRAATGSVDKPVRRGPAIGSREAMRRCATTRPTPTLRPDIKPWILMRSENGIQPILIKAWL